MLHYKNRIVIVGVFRTPILKEVLLRSLSKYLATFCIGSGQGATLILEVEL